MSSSGEFVRSQDEGSRRQSMETREPSRGNALDVSWRPLQQMEFWGAIQEGHVVVRSKPIKNLPLS